MPTVLRRRDKAATALRQHAHTHCWEPHLGAGGAAAAQAATGHPTLPLCSDGYEDGYRNQWRMGRCQSLLPWPTDGCGRRLACRSACSSHIPKNRALPRKARPDTADNAVKPSTRRACRSSLACSTVQPGDTEDQAGLVVTDVHLDCLTCLVPETSRLQSAASLRLGHQI